MAATLEAAKALIAWYWNFGRLRKAPNRISPTAWLSKVYHVASREEALLRAKEFQKTSLGLWGPSQTGKSTLLAEYIDGDSNQTNGNVSLISWQEPVRFSGSETDVQKGITVLNPYRGGRDASGCVSRFTALDKVPFPEAPVQIRFASPKQIMHALAAGYSYECADGANRVWTLLGVEAYLKGLKETEPSATPDPATQRLAYEDLLELLEVFLLLRNAGLSRYHGIHEEEVSTLSELVLENPILLADRQRVADFAAELFWDGHSIFSQTLREVSAWPLKFGGEAGKEHAEIYTSFRIAAHLVDVGSYGDLVGKDDDQDDQDDQNEFRRRARATIERLSFRKEGSTYILCEDGSEAIANPIKEFARIQGATQELVIPLRKAHLPAELQKLFERADLVDFPGVPNEQQRNKKDKRRVADLQGTKGEVDLFAEVLKRGKTLSIVARSTTNFGIDGFTILCRFKMAPGSPDLLSGYIAQWYRSMTQRSMSEARQRDIPLNLLLTFGGLFFKDTLLNSRVPDSFSIFGSLGADLLNRDIVSIMPVNARTPDMKAICEEYKIEEREGVLKIWEADRDCREWFSGKEDLLAEMVNDPGGSTQAVWQQLVRDAGVSRQKPIEKAAKANQTDLQTLFQAAGGQNSDDCPVRLRALERWKKGIDTDLARAVHESMANSLRTDPVRLVASALRKLLSVDSNIFEDIPKQISSHGGNLKQFVKDQLERWTGTVLSKGDLAYTGIADREHLQQVLRAINAHFDTKLESLTKWTRDNLGRVATDSDRKFFRYYLGLRLSKELMVQDKAHAEVTDDTVRLVRDLHEQNQRSMAGEYQLSIHYAAGIVPIHKLIEMLQKSQKPTLQPLEGQEQLADKGLIYPFLRKEAPAN